MRSLQLPHVLLNKAISVNMLWNEFKLRRPLLKAAQNTKASQETLLTRILAENAKTEFGRKHDFASITSIEDYRKNVPVQSYDQLEPFITRQINGEAALTTAPPLYYARTSGTTGRCKDIPLTHHGLRQIEHAQKNLALSLWQGTNFLRGAVLGFASPAEEGRLDNGKPFGSMSGSTYKSLSPLLANKFVLPQSAFSIKDMEAKNQVYALATLAADDLTGIAAANPSSILKLSQFLAENSTALSRTLIGEGLDWLKVEARAILPDIQRRLNKKRLSILLDQIDSGQPFNVPDIWPRLSTIATWTGGSCGVALRQLKGYVPEEVKFVEYGYGSSEFMGSANVDANKSVCLPLLNHHFYEFVKASDWEAEAHRFMGLEELVPGEEYRILVTTGSGLYRYDINDIVRAGPTMGDCPAITFLQKGRGVTNITGEKLSEYQLISSVNNTVASLDVEVGFFMALADENSSRYILYLDIDGLEAAKLLAVKIDENLRELNSEYDEKRSSERLRTLIIRRFNKNAADTIKGWSLNSGIREVQYKPTILAYARDWSEKLAPLTGDW